MVDLFTKYEVSEIFVFLIIACLAIKELIEFFDWIKDRLQQSYKKNLSKKEQSDKTQQNFKDINKFFIEQEEENKELDERIRHLDDQIQLLIASDRDDIKTFITKEHHYFCRQQGWIDDYSLDCIEKRYEHYKQEGGNSFVIDLMQEIKALPKQPPKEKD